ncbi:hypothetical protein R1sor_006675 [Riccia sorocarpa]|uniref:Reverse transcriptase zinc-binding domain-containing protein n=1 Tax=Riccia sorocarpa TaxID=122646 RepID=A0ABD3HR75_9MARC
METVGIEGLETLYRQFLWGWTDQDSPKASLVAWERITQGKADGGLGWTPLRDKSMALQIKNVLKVISESNAEWTRLARSLILRTLRSGRYQRERRQWCVEDALLLTSVNKINGSRTLTWMLAAWNRMRKKKRWDDTCKENPDHLTVNQSIYLIHWGNAAESGQFPDELEKRHIQYLEGWLRAKTLVRKSLLSLDGWKWESDGKKVNWGMATKEWATRVGDRKEFSAYLNSKWGVNDTEQDWKTCWTRLWSAAVHHHKKTWIWHWVQRGYFTGSRGKGWGDDLRKCQRCGSAEETLDHAFWSCSRLQRRLEGLEACGGIPPGCSSMLEWLDKVLEVSKNDTSGLWLFGVYIITTRAERNDLKFNGKRIVHPVHLLLRRTSLEIEAYPNKRAAEKQLDIARRAKSSVQGWMQTAARHAQCHSDEAVVGTLFTPTQRRSTASRESTDDS